MVYGVYENTICGFNLNGCFVGIFTEIPHNAVVYPAFADSSFKVDCIHLEYLYWAIERTHYRNLERSVMQGIYSEHAFTRQFRIFIERWGRCSLDSEFMDEAMRRHSLFSDAQEVLNSTSIQFDKDVSRNKYLYGTVSGRFTNVSGKKNLLAISKEDKKRIVSSYGYFIHIDMKAFHFNILKEEFSVTVPESPYDWLVTKLNVTRKEAKVMCLRWMNSDETRKLYNSAPKFIREIWACRKTLNMDARQFNYELQTRENIKPSSPA